MGRRWKILLIASIGVFLAFLDATIVNVAFPDINRSFPDASLSGLSWVLSAYNIVFAALLVPAGRIADLVGRRRVLVGGLLLFSLASLLCALAPAAEWLVVARLLQAVGAAALIPSSTAFVLSEFPVEQRATALGLYGAAAAVAAATGPSLGGLLIDVSDWRLVFLVNVPIGLLTCFYVLRVFVEVREPAGAAAPDLLGGALVMLAVGALTLGIVQGPTWGWNDPRVVGSFLASIALVPMFTWRCGRHPAPVIELALFRIRSFSGANAGTLLFATGFYGMILCHVLFLTTVWRYSVLDAGLAMSPAPLTTALIAGPGGRLADRFGQRVVIVPGLILFAAGNLLLATSVGTAPDFLADWLPCTVLTGLGIGLAFPCLASAALAELPASQYATGSAINAMLRQLGGAIGVSIVVAIIQGAARVAAIDPFVDSWRFAAGMSLIALPAALAIGSVGARSTRTARGPSEPAVDRSASPSTVERVRQWDPSQSLPQSPAHAIQPNDAGSPTLRLGHQLSRGLKIAFALAGLCVVVGVGLLLLRADAGGVTVYSSAPLQGPQRARSEDMIRGMRLALKEAGNKAGEFDVKFVSMDDSTAAARGWDSSAVIANATRAAADGNSAVYIGEVNSGASALSIPVLSSAKLPQISPSNTAVGLTTDESGADTGEPGKYYVGGFRNYVRLVPRDTIQGDALATLMKRDGCERAAIIHDQDLYGDGLAHNIRVSMRSQGLRPVLDEPLESRVPAYHRTLARRLGLQRADCVVFSGDAKQGAVPLFKAVGAALPRARLYGSDGLAESAFTDVNRGGLPEPLAARVKLTVAALGQEGFGAEGKTFFARFRQEYPDHANPDPYAIYGYEAMSLALDAIERADSADREDIVKALFDTKDRSSVIGRYSIDRNGDTTLTDYGVFGIRDGAPTFERTVKTGETG
jgi:EmrB/QacA subfamily drug resistance transporter